MDPLLFGHIFQAIQTSICHREVFAEADKDRNGVLSEEESILFFKSLVEIQKFNKSGKGFLSQGIMWWKEAVSCQETLAIQVKPSQNEGQKLLPANLNPRMFFLCEKWKLLHPNCKNSPLSSSIHYTIHWTFGTVLSCFNHLQNVPKLEELRRQAGWLCKKSDPGKKSSRMKKKLNMAMEKWHHLQKTQIWQVHVPFFS